MFTNIQSAYGAGVIIPFEIGEILPEWIGWVVGLCVVFAIIIGIEVKIEAKYLGVHQSSNCKITDKLVVHQIYFLKFLFMTVTSDLIFSNISLRLQELF